MFKIDKHRVVQKRKTQNFKLQEEETECSDAGNKEHIRSLSVPAESARNIEVRRRCLISVSPGGGKPPGRLGASQGEASLGVLDARTVLCGCRPFRTGYTGKVRAKGVLPSSRSRGAESECQK